MIFELLGYSTEEHGEDAVRYRAYTSSYRKADAFAKIKRINFTDSGHGIVFVAEKKTGPRKPTRYGCEAHVKAELARIAAEAS
jgi:hypothetical protein